MDFSPEVLQQVSEAFTQLKALEDAKTDKWGARRIMEIVVARGLRAGLDELATTAPPCEACGAVCCSFFDLDVRKDEAIRFNTVEGNIKKNPDGSCYYLVNNRCSVYSERPLMCREFDCREAILFGLAMGQAPHVNEVVVPNTPATMLFFIFVQKMAQLRYEQGIVKDMDYVYEYANRVLLFKKLQESNFFSNPQWAAIDIRDAARNVGVDLSLKSSIDGGTNFTFLKRR